MSATRTYPRVGKTTALASGGCQSCGEPKAKELAERLKWEIFSVELPAHRLTVRLCGICLTDLVSDAHDVLGTECAPYDAD